MTATPYKPKEKFANGWSPGETDAALALALGSEAGRYVPEEVYWSDYYDRGDISYEWNNGYLEEKPVADYAQFRLYLWFLGLVKDFLHVNAIGRMIGLEMGFRMALRTGVAIRKPDLAVVLNNNPVALRDKDRSYRGIFDLCIESISDSSQGEVERDTVTKRLEYAAAGVREYFILDERALETAFYQLVPGGIYVPIQPVDGIIRSQVLPGFQFRLDDLYRLPDPPTLVTDPVYQDYTSPFLRAERERTEREWERAERERARAEAATQAADSASAQKEQAQLRAEEERMRAEEERLRAEEEHQRAEAATQRATQAEEQAARYAAMLRALGIAVDEL